MGAQTVRQLEEEILELQINQRMTPARRLELELPKIAALSACGGWSIEKSEKRRLEIRALLPTALEIEDQVRSRQSDRFMKYFLGWGAVLAGLVFYWIAERSETAAALSVAWIAYGIWKMHEHDTESELIVRTNSAWYEQQGAGPSRPHRTPGL